MHRFAWLLLAGAVALVGAMALAAEGAPRGRVIRVERGAAATVPRICAMGGSRGQHMCFGEPRVGDRIAVIDLSERRVRGEFVIESVTDATELAAMGLCISSGVRTVKGSYVSGTEEGGHIMGMRGAKLNRNIARVMTGVSPPSGRSETEESVELAVDADGNGKADLILTQYACDQNGSLSSGGEGRCFDTYLEQRGGLHRVQQDILRSCR